ncbi:MAG: hypothetical protein FWD57_16670 [Polyangiaceae bacterium]|nr:hypothetical protein [Polyangiaceae bacterium]
MNSKVLFVVFSKNPCRRNHAIRYALDLHQKGHTARIILEGPATWAIKEVTDPHSDFGKLFIEAERAGLVAGVCKTASARRCSGNDCTDIASLAESRGIALLDIADGHASIEPFVRDGYQVIVF